tara:strand:+ start:866 stop:1114 length:249 start_codon:yes stop_codon:yes gene_type:complete
MALTDQQQHLQSAIQQQNELVNDIQVLQNQITGKKELAVKAQGIIEYLQQIGVELPKEGEGTTPEVTIPDEPVAVTPEVEGE